MTPLLWGAIPKSGMFKSETRYCSMLIGAVTVMWSFIGLIHAPDSLFVKLLNAADLGVEWFFMMLVTGILLVLTSIFPMRSIRHISLFATSLVWTSMTGVFLIYHVLTPVTVSAPLFALWPVLLMYSDAKQKTRGAK